MNWVNSRTRASVLSSFLLDAQLIVEARLYNEQNNAMLKDKLECLDPFTDWFTSTEELYGAPNSRQHKGSDNKNTLNYSNCITFASKLAGKWTANRPHSPNKVKRCHQD
jgi:hypothetical protein